MKISSIIQSIQKNRNIYSSSKNNTLILIISIFFTCILSDIYLINNHLILIFSLTAIASNSLTFLSIPKLQELKLKQIIRKEGPKKHLKKKGTPTLGGVIIIPIGITGGLLSNLFSIGLNEIIATSLLTILVMFIGIIDDLLSIINKQNMGLNSINKILLQIISAGFFLCLCYQNAWIEPNVTIWFNQNIDLQYLIWPLALFVLLAQSNSTNLTDGLDGLVAGCGALVFTGLSIHLNINNNDIDLALSRFCISMAGSLIGFLLMNTNPAKIFMGDSGSLAIGSSLAGVALISNNLWPLLIMGLIFLAESLSVIIQVGTFKLTKKFTGYGQRVFRMAPIHHHFEITGSKEHIIVRNFWIMTCVFIVLSFFI